MEAACLEGALDGAMSCFESAAAVTIRVTDIGARTDEVSDVRLCWGRRNSVSRGCVDMDDTRWDLIVGPGWTRACGILKADTEGCCGADFIAGVVAQQDLVWGERCRCSQDADAVALWRAFSVVRSVAGFLNVGRTLGHAGWRVAAEGFCTVEASLSNINRGFFS